MESVLVINTEERKMDTAVPATILTVKILGLGQNVRRRKGIPRKSGRIAANH